MEKGTRCDSEKLVAELYDQLIIDCMVDLHKQNLLNFDESGET